MSKAKHEEHADCGCDTGKRLSELESATRSLVAAVTELTGKMTEILARQIQPMVDSDPLKNTSASLAPSGQPEQKGSTSSLAFDSESFRTLFGNLDDVVARANELTKK